MKLLKKLLLSILGEKRYLKLLATSFQTLYRTGNLGKSYQDIYFLHHIVKEKSYCIDIGAHLGYYTFELSRIVKEKGHVYAVEPMSKFQEVLKKIIERKQIQNVELLQVALGGEGEYVEMGIPQVSNIKKFGYARVMSSSTHLDYVESEKVKNENGDRLFKDLSRLDFIKCDVEGLEVAVFSSMLDIIKKFRPILLCELAEKTDRIKIQEMLVDFGYNTYMLVDKKLHLLDVYSNTTAISHNHYFIPSEQEARLASVIAP